MGVTAWHAKEQTSCCSCMCISYMELHELPTTTSFFVRFIPDHHNFFRDGTIVHHIFIILFEGNRCKKTILHMCYQLQNLYLGSWPVQYLFIDPTNLSTWFFSMISLPFSESAYTIIRSSWDATYVWDNSWFDSQYVSRSLNFSFKFLILMQ